MGSIDSNLLMGGLLALVRENWQALEPDIDAYTGEFFQRSDAYEQNRIAQLQESEERFSKAFRFSAAGMTLTTLDGGRIIDVNDHFLRETGYQREEVVGRTMLELNIWMDLRLRNELMQKLKKFGTVHNLEVEFRRRSGEIAVMLLSAELITLNGEACILAAGMDITKRKEVEEALQQSEARFRVIAESEACAVFVFQDGRLLYFNPATESITGYSSEELRAMEVWNLAHPDFRATVKRRGLARQRGEVLPSRYEIKLLTKSGEERWINYAAGLISFEGLPAVLATAFDITDRKHSEQALRESEEKFSIAFRSCPAAIVISEFKSGQTARFIDVNEKVLRITGYKREEIVGQSISRLNLWVDESERLKMLQILEVSGSVSDFKMRFRRKSGEIGVAVIYCEKIKLRGEAYILTMVLEIMNTSVVPLSESNLLEPHIHL